MSIRPAPQQLVQLPIYSVACLLAAAALAALDTIISKLGTGWTFTLLTGLTSLAVPMTFYYNTLKENGDRKVGISHQSDDIEDF